MYVSMDLCIGSVGDSQMVSGDTLLLSMLLLLLLHPLGSMTYFVTNSSRTTSLACYRRSLSNSEAAATLLRTFRCCCNNERLFDTATHCCCCCCFYHLRLRDVLFLDLALELTGRNALEGSLAAVRAAAPSTLLGGLLALLQQPVAAAAFSVLPGQADNAALVAVCGQLQKLSQECPGELKNV